MPKYGILMYPSYNRVYFQSSKTLAVAELTVANNRLSQPCLDIGQNELAGVDYITFNTEKPINDEDIKILSRLSFVYAIYEISEQDKLVLYPIAVNAMAYFDDDLVTILKYSGKTNEAFTKLLVNIGWLTSDSFNNEKIHLLDPICGKGTSLYQGLIYGFNVSGIELDRMAVQQATTFFTKYLKTKRYKHKVSQSKISENGKKICEVTKYEMANTKDAYKGGETLNAEFLRGDTVQTAKFIKKNSIDIIVGDLPYGIQHGSNTQSGSFTRNPEGLLKEALPQWQKVLKLGGTLVLSWNTFVLKKENIADIMNASGLTVISGEPYDNFTHRVDQAIIRDIIIGKKLS
ncbi:MAG: SAM-dependent methyltransferase [Firmicutes bacterium]|nr:SAM-dependent methyltransferase [Bacillota bacterium]